MFHRGSFFMRLLVFLVLAAALAGAGSALFRAGFTQGYAQGALVTSGGEQPVAPWLPYSPGWGVPYFGFFPFFPIAGFFLFGLLLFGLFAGLFRRGPWGARPWGYDAEGHPHWHGPHHPHPWDQEGRPEPPAASGPEQPADNQKDNR